MTHVRQTTALRCRLLTASVLRQKPARTPSWCRMWHSVTPQPCMQRLSLPHTASQRAGQSDQRTTSASPRETAPTAAWLLPTWYQPANRRSGYRSVHNRASDRTPPPTTAEAPTTQPPSPHHAAAANADSQTTTTAAVTRHSPPRSNTPCGCGGDRTRPSPTPARAPATQPSHAPTPPPQTPTARRPPPRR